MIPISSISFRLPAIATLPVKHPAAHLRRTNSVDNLHKRKGQLSIIFHPSPPTSLPAPPPSHSWTLLIILEHITKSPHLSAFLSVLPLFPLRNYLNRTTVFTCQTASHPLTHTRALTWIDIAWDGKAVSNLYTNTCFCRATHNTSSTAPLPLVPPTATARPTRFPSAPHPLSNLNRENLFRHPCYDPPLTVILGKDQPRNAALTNQSSPAHHHLLSGFDPFTVCTAPCRCNPTVFNLKNPLNHYTTAALHRHHQTETLPYSTNHLQSPPTFDLFVPSPSLIHSYPSSSSPRSKKPNLPPQHTLT
eukprot:GFKZ01001282.1.p1 GENE.GFKZ01001282.1~~GFKZ01001282.1.p1  ORF type:complete len:304 (-),score=18.19 GFKZ01001282.1:587-1498(-)